MVNLFQNKIESVQKRLHDDQIDGWLLYDFRRSNDLALQFLEIPFNQMLSRRIFYWIPKSGEPIKIVSQIEPHALDHLPGHTWLYHSWKELEVLLSGLKLNNLTIAMEYSPNNALPVVSKVDAGTVEQIKKQGAQVVSSANIFQSYICVLTDSQVKSHFEAAHCLNAIADRTWKWIESHLNKKKTITEYDVQQFMLQEIEENGFICDHAPICAVNAHSADPHYSPTSDQSTIIKTGDFILIDLWCKKNHLEAIYADIARVAIAAKTPLPIHVEIFDYVKKAREAALSLIQKQYQNNQLVKGFEVDLICREMIEKAGYGPNFVHRTGHNIGIRVHGDGANLDNLETHDDRDLIAGTCFSIEPGIYLTNQFGIRLEYDVYLNPNGRVEVTGGIQEEIVCLDL